jgi:hypothetical protein
MSEQKSPTPRRRKPLPPSPEWVTIREVAAYACVSESAVSRGSKPGAATWPFSLLRRVEIGSRVLFTRASFSHMCRVMKASADVVSIDERGDEEQLRKSA